MQEDWVCINVTVSGGQVREAVALNFLRPIFQPGDLVEVLSERDGRTYIAGVISPDQSSAATRVGYQVELEGGSETLANVSPLQLRRRFRASSAVEIYRGPTLGWCEAYIHHEAASSTGCGAEPWPLFQEPTGPDLQAAYGCWATGPLGGFGDTEHDLPKQAQTVVLEGTGGTEAARKRLAMAEIGLWTRIPLSTAAGAPEWVPSCLIRAFPG